MQSRSIRHADTRRHRSRRRGRAAWLLSVLLAPAAAAVQAGEWQLAAGVADEIDGDRVPVATLGYVFQAAVPWELVGGWLGSRRASGAGRRGDTAFVAANLRWAGDWWFLGGGVALIGQRSEVLSSHGQFMTLAGVRGGRWRLTLRHLSNAGIAGRNRGETFLTLGRAW